MDDKVHFQVNKIRPNKLSDFLQAQTKETIQSGLLTDPDSFDVTDQYAALRFVRASTKNGVPPSINWIMIPGDDADQEKKPYWVGTIVYDTVGDNNRVFQVVSKNDPRQIKDLRECDIYQSTSYINDEGKLTVSEPDLSTSSTRYASSEMEALLSETNLVSQSESSAQHFKSHWASLYQWEKKQLPDGSETWVGARSISGDALGPHDEFTDIEFVVLPDPAAVSDEQCNDVLSQNSYIQRRKKNNEMSDYSDEGLSDSGNVLWTIKSSGVQQKATIGFDSSSYEKPDSETSNIASAEMESTFEWANRMDFESRLFKSQQAARVTGSENGRDMTMAEKIRLFGVGLGVVGAATFFVGLAPLALAGTVLGIGAAVNIPIIPKLIQAHYLGFGRVSTDSTFRYDQGNDHAELYKYGDFKKAEVQRELGLTSIAPIEQSKRFVQKVFSGVVGAISAASFSPLTSYFANRYSIGEAEDHSLKSKLSSSLIKGVVGIPLAAAAIFTSPVWGGAFVGGMAVYGFAKSYLKSSASVTPQAFYSDYQSRKLDSAIGIAEKFTRVVFDICLDGIEGGTKMISGVFSGQGGLINRLGKKREINEDSSIPTLKDAQIKGGF